MHAIRAYTNMFFRKKRKIKFWEIERILKDSENKTINFVC